VVWFWLGLALMWSCPVAATAHLVWLHGYLRRKYLHYVVRIFKEKPLFIVPRGQPVADAEDFRITTADGLSLQGCYLKAPSRRRGVLLFGLEFGSNRWACVSYTDYLREAGYDICAVEFRGQGDSDPQPGYHPLQWVTDYEVRDMQAAIAYLKGRGDADPKGIGFFGLSKGAGAGLQAGARDPYIRCFVTDGAFGTYTTLVPYMRQWFRIYNQNHVRQALLPSWYYGSIGLVGLRQIEREENCHFPHLERALPRLRRPWLLIHGSGDTYIKPEMARALFDHARPPKELWLVPDAKHNQAFHVAGDEYRRRVLEFFNRSFPEPTPIGPGSTAGSKDSRMGGAPRPQPLSSEGQGESGPVPLASESPTPPRCHARPVEQAPA
jgi:pimeloyl-ACP methyl ester carboxylesterase